ncbi:hypothetical protein SCG7109_AE_00150 [Chlamydiales bacterium SCGC AG-110-M15]|nr:hypothetical protein SCG7109_AE_00150 [Chlamydiales bacterium SCGC AG-110-M15]
MTRYTYHPQNHQIASKELIDCKGQVKEKIQYVYDKDAVLIESYESHEKETLYQAIRIKNRSPGKGKPELIEEGSFSKKKRHPLRRERIKYGKWDLPIERSFYNSKNHLLYTIKLSYDSMGRVIEERDSRGKAHKYQYDQAGNLICQTNPDGSFVIHKYNSFNQCVKSNYNKQKQVSYDYDSQGNKTLEVDFYGNKKIYSHDRLGRLSKEEVEGLKGSATHYTYDTLGNRSSKKDSKGIVRTLYTVQGKPYLISYPDGSKERYVYTKWGRLERKIERNGTYTAYAYDTLERCVKEERFGTDAKSFAVKTCLYKNGHLAWEKDEEGKLSKYHYDIWGRLSQEKLEDRLSEFLYDPSGRLSIVKSPYLQIHKSYDTFDRFIKEEKKEGNTLLHRLDYAYDLNDNCIQETKYNENGPLRSHYTFDLFSRETSHANEKGHQTFTDYNDIETFTDALGRQKVKTFDALRRVSSETRLNAQSQIIDQKEFLYDCHNNKIQETHRVYHKDQEDHTVITKWLYGPTGNLETLIEAVGTIEERRTQFVYKNTQLIKKIKANGIEINHLYNPQGKVSETFSSDNSIHYRYTYSPSGRPLKVENLLTQKSTERSYDLHGSILEDLSENNQNVSYRYDQKGRCTHLTLPDSSSIHYSYNGLYLKSVKRGAYTHSYDQEDLSGRVLKETHFNGTSSDYHYNLMGQKIDATSPHYSWHINEYDPVNRLIAYESNDPISKTEHSFAYDDCDQIISEKSFKDHLFDYDSRGNRLSKDDDIYKVNHLDELLEFSNVSREYLDGNLIQNGEVTLSYDAWDRMISSEKPLQWRVDYQYDAFNRRLSKKVYTWQDKWIEKEEIHYIYQDDIEIGSENDLQILGRNRQAVALEIDQEIYTPIYDRTCSIALLLDLSNTVVSHNRYTAFGEFETYGLKSPWVYSNKRLDEETGFIFFGRRYYEPLTGRWTTQDPLGFADGPNLYAYVHNDPLRFIDYEGLYHRAIHSGSSFRTKQEEAIFYGAATGAASHTVRTGLSLVNLGAWTVGAKGIQRTLDGYDSYLSDPRNLNYAGFSHKHFSSGFTQGEYAAIGYESIMGGAGLLKAGKFALTKASSLIRSSRTWRLDKNLLSQKRGIALLTHQTKTTKQGYELSKHVLFERMEQRGITKSMIDKALEKGAKYFDSKNDTYNFILKEGFASGKSLLVGQGKESRKITTAIRGKSLIKSRFQLVE